MIEVCSLQRTSQTPLVVSLAYENGTLKSGGHKANSLGNQRARNWLVFLTIYKGADSMIKIPPLNCPR